MGEFRRKRQGVTDRLAIRRRCLPHWQLGGSTYFLTFRSIRGPLPEPVLKHIVETVLYDHGRRYELIFGVVMPDHVHIVICPKQVAEGVWHSLPKIMQGIKGASARRINQQLRTKGPVWQGESFDRIVRDDEELQEKLEYMYENPVRSGLVGDCEDWPFFVVPP